MDTKESPPICDINPEHGAMQIEPMYNANHEIFKYGWFCQVKDCDGYGGPAQIKRSEAMTDAEAQAETVQRWGSNGRAHHNTTSKMCDVGIIESVQPFTELLLGWGETWEEAFAMANKRIKENQHEQVTRLTQSNVPGRLQQNPNPAGKKAKERTTYQLDLPL